MGKLTSRDQLGVVTRAYFAQRSVQYLTRTFHLSDLSSDFTQTDILEDFYNSLEMTLEGKADESAIYMGTLWTVPLHFYIFCCDAA